MRGIHQSDPSVISPTFDSAFIEQRVRETGGAYPVEAVRGFADTEQTKRFGGPKSAHSRAVFQATTIHRRVLSVQTT